MTTEMITIKDTKQFVGCIDTVDNGTLYVIMEDNTLNAGIIFDDRLAPLYTQRMLSFLDVNANIQDFIESIENKEIVKW